MNIIYSKDIKDLINKYKKQPNKQKEIINAINNFGARMINEDFGLIDPDEKRLMIHRARKPEYDQDLYGKYLLNGSNDFFDNIVYIYYDADTDETYAVSDYEFKNHYQADWTREKEPEEWYQYIIWYDFEDPENYKETGKSMKVKQPFDDDFRVKEIYEKELGKPVIVEEDINEYGYLKYQYKNKAQWNPKKKSNTFLRAQTHEFWKPYLNRKNEIGGNEEDRLSTKSEIEMEQLYPSLTPKLAKEAVEKRLGTKYRKELDEILNLAKDKKIGPDKVYKVIYDFLRRRYYNEEILKKVKEDLLLEKPQMFFHDNALKDVIKKKPEGYVIYSEKGKKLSKAYPTKEEAMKRLKEIEYFKHAKDSKRFSKEQLEKNIRKPLEKFLLSEGYEKDEIDDYLVIEIKEEDEDITNNDNKCIHIQVRNEFVGWYDLPDDVCEALDKVVAPGYFEPYDATTWDAYIFENAQLKDSDTWSSFELKKGEQSEEFKRYLRTRGYYFEPSEHGNYIHFEVKNADKYVEQRATDIEKHWSKFEDNIKDAQLKDNFAMLEVKDGAVKTIKKLDNEIYIEQDLEDKKYYLASDYDRYIFRIFDTVKEAEEFYKYHKDDVKHSLIAIPLADSKVKDTLLHPELYGKNVKLIVNNALSSTIDRMYGKEIISKNIINKNKIEYVLPYNGRFDYFNRRFNRKFEVVDSMKDSVNYVIENVGIDMTSIKEVSDDCFVLRGMVYGKENGKETVDNATFLYHLGKNKVELLNFFNKFNEDEKEKIEDILLENINTNHVF